MHEMGIANSILEAAHKELHSRFGLTGDRSFPSPQRAGRDGRDPQAAGQRAATQAPFCGLRKVGVRIGEFAGVDPESLRFCFEAIVKSSSLEPLELEIEWCRAGEPYAGDPDRRYSGEELELAFLEFDDAELPQEVAV